MDDTTGSGQNRSKRNFLITAAVFIAALLAVPTVYAQQPESTVIELKAEVAQLKLQILQIQSSLIQCQAPQIQQEVQITQAAVQAEQSAKIKSGDTKPSTKK